ncbi:MAG TPA: TIGR00730 family Rossman fold protein [Bryobacteraceae bacterium]
MLRRLCVFCGSSFGTRPVYAEAARELGRVLTERGIELIYGGSHLGLMGALADACLARSGRVIGVMPRALVEKEIAHRGLTELCIVESMHERKALMADLAEAFIGLPGGFGTWEEFCEVLTWSQLGLHRKACALLNVNGYYDPLLAMVDRAQQEGFLRDVHRELVLTDTDPERLLDRLGSYVVPAVDKWIGRVER